MSSLETTTQNYARHGGMLVIQARRPPWRCVLELNMKEAWLPIIGFPKYEISNKGRIRSHWRKKPNILKPLISNHGYYVVQICNEDRNLNTFVHRLLALAFIKGKSYGLDVNHKNGIKTDNRLCNLEWCTRSENIKHAFRLGLNKARPMRGSLAGMAKLKESDIVPIFKLYAAGASRDQIAETYKVSKRTIVFILDRATWTHVAVGELERIKNRGRQERLPAAKLAKLLEEVKR